MGVIRDAVRDLILQQVEEKGIVVWYDPAGSYRELAASLRLPDTRLLRYETSFFALRRAAEPALADDEPGRLVVYVPLARPACDNALIELETAGVVVAPGQPGARNSRLSLAARRCLQGRLGADDLAALEARIEAGELGLADLDELASRPSTLTFGVLALIFGGGSPLDVAVSFLSDRSRDAELMRKNALRELAEVLHAAAGAAADVPASPEPLRERLARHVLLGEPAGEPRCVAVAQRWRERRAGYAEWAERVERSLPPGPLPIEGETFLGQERARLLAASTALADGDGGQREIARKGQAGFWAGERPEVQAHWALLAAAAELLHQAGRVLAALRTLPPDPAAVLKAYTEGAEPFCLLDTAQRHLERRWAEFPHGPSAEQRPLVRLMARARDGYTEAAGRLSEFFLRRCSETRFRLPGVPRQSDIFARHVRPRLDEGRTAYLLVDALRYEMARELALLAADGFRADLRHALAAAPTVTEVGMAALLPGADDGEIVADEGRPVFAIGRPLRDRAARMKYLAEQFGGELLALHLHELLPTPKKRLLPGLARARLVVVTSREIDSLGEAEEDVLLARQTMEDMLHQLRRAVRLLCDQGIDHVVLAADHGFLFGEELAAEMKIPPPRGEPLTVSRRAWVGRSPEAGSAYVRLRLSDLGWRSDLEMACPWGLGGFRARGGRAYFHGGLSLPEWVVPVLALTPRAAPAGEGVLRWQLLLPAGVVHSPLFSVTVAGARAGLFTPPLPAVRVEVRARGETVSAPVSASYGFEEATGDVQLRYGEASALVPCTLALRLVRPLDQKTVSLHLTEAATGAELARVDRVAVAD